MSAIKYLSCILLLFFTSRIYSQIPDTVWTKTFGGPLADVGNSVNQTTDGGFIIAGTTSSFGAGGQDIWLIKTDENGDTLWTKTFGGTGNDRTANVVQTNDNGYAVFGTTNSYGNGGDDFLLWKADSLGNTEWFKTYGTNYNEVVFEGLQAMDGGFILGGYYERPDRLAWLVKADSQGVEIWNRMAGKDNNTIESYTGKSVQEATDGSIFIGGNWVHYYLNGYRLDLFLQKFSGNGDSLLYKTYTNVGNEILTSMRKTTDGNLILAAVTLSQVPWLVKITSAGSIIWSRILIVSEPNVYVTSIEPLTDGGYIVSIGSNWATLDIDIVKADSNGILTWELMIGGSGTQVASSVYPTTDHGYVVTGKTNSLGAGDYDIWLLKFNYPPSPEIQNSKDSLNLMFDDISFTSQDSVTIYNSGNATLNIDTIYSTNASGFFLDIVLKDTTIHTAVTWRHNYYEPFEIESGDSAKLIFTYPLWVPKNNNIVETWLDTIIILNNSVNNGSLAIPAIIDFPVGIANEINNLPLEFSLQQNYPNPFNPSTKIKFTIPNVETRHASSLQMVTLRVYDVLGNEVATLFNEEKQPGIYEVEFNGEKLPTGIYFYQLKAGNFVETKKMVLIK